MYSQKIFCSIIIPTIGRQKLNRAVNSAINQDFSSNMYEIIVVNDSGHPLPKERWQLNENVTVIHTNRRERCFARNAGATISKGSYLHFLDDDDWIEPTFLRLLKESAETNPEHVLYFGSTQLWNRNNKKIIKLVHNLPSNSFVHTMSGEWIPLQASIIEAEKFFEIGGFDNLMKAGQDVDLFRRLSLVGDFSEIKTVISNVEMGVEESSTNYSQGVELTRAGREIILSMPNVLTRLFDSATNASLYGRILRIYLTSAFWNFSRLKFALSLERTGWAAAVLVYSGLYVFKSDFWKNVLNKYDSPSFLNGFLEEDKPVTRR